MVFEGEPNDKQRDLFDFLSNGLRQYSHLSQIALENTRHAAVAIVIREYRNCIDVLFIKRATVAGDPWSGHMAFPGGHFEPLDRSMLDTAIRETLEETGVQLTTDQCIGRLPDQQPANRGNRRRIVVTPFVFGIRTNPRIHCNHEVEECVWGSLDQLKSGTLRTIRNLEFNQSAMSFEGHLLGDRHFVWGLTHRILDSLLSVLPINPN